MKFAEHLSAHITPEWRKQYIAYEVSLLVIFSFTLARTSRGPAKLRPGQRVLRCSPRCISNWQLTNEKLWDYVDYLWHATNCLPKSWFCYWNLLIVTLGIRAFQLDLNRSTQKDYRIAVVALSRVFPLLTLSTLFHPGTDRIEAWYSCIMICNLNLANSKFVGKVKNNIPTTVQLQTNVFKWLVIVYNFIFSESFNVIFNCIIFINIRY